MMKNGEERMKINRNEEKKERMMKLRNKIN